MFVKKIKDKKKIVFLVVLTSCCILMEEMYEEICISLSVNQEEIKKKNAFTKPEGII